MMARNINNRFNIEVKKWLKLTFYGYRFLSKLKIIEFPIIIEFKALILS